jgi:hypothetical protein
VRSQLRVQREKSDQTASHKLSFAILSEAKKPSSIARKEREILRQNHASE